MRSLSKEENQKPFFNRQVIDISSKRSEGDDKFGSTEQCDGNGIWSKFVGLMRSSLNINLVNKSVNSNRHSNEIENKRPDSKKNIEKMLTRRQKESNFAVNRRVHDKKSIYEGTSNSSSVVLPSTTSFSIFQQPSYNGNNIGISFAEQILNFGNKECNNRNSVTVPTTPTTLDGGSTTTSPAFTNIQLSSPSTNNTRKQIDTPDSKVYNSMESINSFQVKDEYYNKKKNHAIDFSADDNHLDNIMDIINEKIIFGEIDNESETKLDYIRLLNSNSIFYDKKEEINSEYPFCSDYSYLFNSEFRKNVNEYRDITSQIVNETSLFFPLSKKSDNVCYSWREAKQLMSKLKSSTKVYKYNDVPFSEWIHEQIPTLGASPTSCRVQEMFKSIVKSKKNDQLDTMLFIKKIPRNIWAKQWEMHEIWDGDYVTDGEDFVMEAAALAFLQDHSENIAPRLCAILEHSEESVSDKGSYSKNIKRSSCDYLLNKDTTHIMLVSEYYGEDLLDYLDKCEKQNKVLTNKEKKELQYKLAVIMDKLHKKGLSHLDFTPENILIGPNGINICDFAKSTPIITNNPRHTHYCKKSTMSLIEDFNSNNISFNFINPPPEAYYEFESCEPTVGKGAYMPPECWKIFWRLEENKIQYPLEELMEAENNAYFNYHSYCKKNIHKYDGERKSSECNDLNDRSQFYFNVRIADVYMLGIIMFWIWSDGGIWKYSDTRQDHRYQNLIFSSLNFDIFRECRNWDNSFKSLLKRMLEPDPNKRITLSEVLKDSWWKCDTK